MSSCGPSLLLDLLLFMIQDCWCGVGADPHHHTTMVPGSWSAVIGEGCVPASWVLTHCFLGVDPLLLIPGGLLFMI